jgi:hypothetical protein
MAQYPVFELGLISKWTGSSPPCVAMDARQIPVTGICARLNKGAKRRINKVFFMGKSSRRLDKDTGSKFVTKKTDTNSSFGGIAEG